MNDLFSNWLASGDAGPCCFQDSGHAYIVVRIEKTRTLNTCSVSSSITRKT